MKKNDEKTKENTLLKNNKSLVIVISSVLIIMIICITIVLASNKGNNITKLFTTTTDKSSEQYANAQTENTNNDNINMECEILETLQTGEYKTKLMFSTDLCIKSVELINKEDFKQTRPENAEDEHSMNLEFNAEKGNEYNIKITLANSAIVQKKFLVNDYIREENRAPALPVIHAWPQETTIKFGRKVQLTATSEDPDGDLVKFEWQYRDSETSEWRDRLGESVQYPVGRHFVRVKAIDQPYGLESDWAEYSFEVINEPATTVKYSLTEPGNPADTNFNITVPINNVETATTFGNHGYTTVLKVNGRDKAITGGTGSYNGITLNTTLEPIADGNDIKIKYTIVNNSSDSKTVGISTYADITINGHDDEGMSIVNIAGNRGFIMTDGVYNFRAFLRDTPNVTNVDKYWFGSQIDYFDDESNIIWTDKTMDRIEDEDSAMALSWQNRQIGPGQTQEYSFILGVE